MSFDFNFSNGQSSNRNIRGEISIDNFPDNSPNYLFLSSDELKTARNFLLSISFFGILYAGYNIKIEALFGTKIVDVDDNLSTVLFLLIFFQLLIFLLLYIRDVIKNKTDNKDTELKEISYYEKLKIELAEHQKKDPNEFNKNHNNDNNNYDNYHEKTRDLKSRIRSQKNDYLKQKNEYFQRLVLYIFVDGVFPLILSSVAFVFLWNKTHLFYLIQKLWGIIGCWICLFIIVPIVLFFIINYFLSDSDDKK